MNLMLLFSNFLRYGCALACVAAVLTLAGCSKKKAFMIQGEIEGIGTQLVNATYYSQGGLKRVTVVAAENKFALKGEAPRPTLVTLTLADGTRLGTLVAENGDKLKLKGDIAEPYAIEVEGNGDSEKIARWVKENAGLLESRNAAAINRSLTEWVGKNRSSKAATALMVTYYQTPGYEHQADSLMALLSSGARAQEVVQNFTGTLSAQLGEAASGQIGPMSLYDVTDSVVTVNPHQRKALVYCFLSTDRTARDTVTARLRALTRECPLPKVEVVEISSASDSATWKQSLAGDSARWRRTWAPATVASSELRRLGVPRYPYFIVADSAGNQIYRGSSVGKAAEVAKNKFKTSK